jgi:site-specific recombinase XerD
MQRWDRLVEEYLAQLDSRGVSIDHVRGVRRELERLGAWLKRRRGRPHLEQVGAEELIIYLRNRTAFRAKGTLSSILSILRCWGNYLVEQGIWSSNPLRWMRGPQLRPRVPGRIGKSAMEKLWSGASNHRHAYARPLWVAVLALLYGTGLRRGELARLNVDDYVSAERVLRIDGRKTGRQRMVAVPELACRCLENYLPQRANQLVKAGRFEPQLALLVNQSGGRLSSQAISVGVQRIARRAGIGHLTLHQFRHTCASDLLEEGIRLPEVQRQLGHQAIATTVRYLHIADPQRREAVERHPLNSILASVQEGVLT